jgi:hypothetical protein
MKAQPGQARADRLTRRFIEALNARDVDGLAEISDDGIELRHPRGGPPLRGREGLERVVQAAVDADVLLARAGEPEVNSENGVTHVKQAVRETVRGSEIRGTAIFEVRAGKITAFEIESELLRG